MKLNAGNFGKWAEELLLPNLDQPCAIVMDNASYPSVKTDRAPTSSTRKADIQVFINIVMLFCFINMLAVLKAN